MTLTIVAVFRPKIDSVRRACCAASKKVCIVLLTLAITGNVGLAQTRVWQPQGPGPETLGQVENIDDREVIGAIHAVAPHPTNPDILYVGAVNGGIWRTANADDPSPIWVPQTDAAVSLSIGALEFDPTDASNQTLVAGIGRFGNYGGSDGGSRSGLLRTEDGGATWTLINGGGALVNLDVSGVAARGETLVIADANGSGIWRSTDTGANWVQISGQPGSGLPAGAAFDLAGVVGAQATLYTNSGANAVYQSTDTGATWALVSTAAMNGFAPVTNVQLATGPGNVVYAAVVQRTVVGGNNNDNLVGVFRSGDGGANWAALDIPGTTETGGNFFGIHPGAQGDINLSLAADPSTTNSTIVYIGGDRQPGPGDVAGLTWPNSIGAGNFTGRLFRGDASQPAGTQFVHLTHRDDRGPAGGGTNDRSAPHADSRDMAFDANGDLIEVDDGGIYRRTQPLTNAGDWFSMIGNIQVTEFHSVAWDAVANVVIGGTQDVGTPDQLIVSNPRWQDLSQGDGGVVAVDDISTPGLSTRFFGNARLRALGMANQLNSDQYDGENEPQGQALVPLTVVGGGAAINPQFYTPIEINNVDGTRMIIGAQNGVYESLDSGQTVTQISPIQINRAMPGATIAFGATGNVDMLYVGSGNQVFVRNGPDPANVLVASATYAGGVVAGIANSISDPQVAYVIDNNSVFETPDGGGNWNDITGDLLTLNPGRLRSVAYFELAGDQTVVVGTDRGVYWAEGAPFTTWTEACSGLPNAPVFELEYDPADRVLLAGTLGRGAWTCYPAREQPTQYDVKFVCGDGDGDVLARGIYRTAINLQNRDDAGSGATRYNTSYNIGLPGETSGGQTGLVPGPTLAPGEAVEIDCADVFQHAAGLCTGGFCKGFARIESLAPLDIVAVYTSADAATQQVTGLHTERVSEDDTSCPTRTVTIAPRTLLLVPPHTRGDRDFNGHGPCINFQLDLKTRDGGMALVAEYEMQAYECSDAFDAPKSDHTSAEGSSEVTLRSTGAGGRILGHTVDASFRHSFIDTDHAEDTFNFNANEPVQSLRYVGDTGGNEAGTKTRVFVTLRQTDVQMESCAIPQ